LLHNVLYPFASYEHWNPLLADPLLNHVYTIEPKMYIQVTVI
jgi:hypothetical protein